MTGLSDRRRTAGAARRMRLRLPVPPPAARVLGAGERGPAAAGRSASPRAEARRGRTSFWTASASGPGPTTGRRRLSGGEQQRVAFCRALANAPRLLLADEPTGNLDPGTSDVVFDVLMDLVRETGLSALIATHNGDLAARMDRVFRLDDGRLEEPSSAG